MFIWNPLCEAPGAYVTALFLPDVFLSHQYGPVNRVNSFLNVPKKSKLGLMLGISIALIIMSTEGLHNDCKTDLRMM